LAYGAKGKSEAMIDVASQSLGDIDQAKGVLRDIEALKKTNDQAKTAFEATKQELITAQQDVNAYLQLVDLLPKATSADATVMPLPTRAFWNQALADIWTVLEADARNQSKSSNPKLHDPDLHRKQELWPKTNAIEVLRVSGKVTHYNTTEKKTVDSNDPKAISGPNICRVMTITIEGTIPNIDQRQNEVPTVAVENRLAAPLRDKWKCVTKFGAPVEYRSVQGVYPYEPEDPRKKIAEDEQKAKEEALKAAASGTATSTTTEKKPVETPPSVLRPYRGGDYWFSLKLTRNLDNPDIKVEVDVEGDTPSEPPPAP
jgi:hypothetical protein